MLTQAERNRLQDFAGSDIKPPDYAVLTYAVCTLDENACGWDGWMLESAVETVASKTGILANGDDPVPSVTLQICPTCGGELFRTDTAQVYDLTGPAGQRMDRR